MKRLWADPVAEILETMPPAVQQLVGFREYQPKMKLPRDRNPRRDYEGTAKRLGKFSIKELAGELSVNLDTTYKWAAKAQRRGLLRFEKKGLSKIYIWTGPDE